MLAALFFFLVFLAVPVQAGEEFHTSYQVNYQVHPSGLVTVNQNVSLTNQLSRVYASEYSMNTGDIEFRSVKAWDAAGPLTITTKKENNSQTLHLVFNEKVVGKGKTLNFTLEYETLELASQKGQTWEIRLPKLSNAGEIDEYQLTLQTPAGFGQAAYIIPQPVQSQPSRYIFNKTAAIQGINALFGRLQVFEFQLSYPLENSESRSQSWQIALPPDTSWQKVIYQNLEPRPKNVIVDPDGNWLAEYQLLPGEKITVIAAGSAQVFLQPLADRKSILVDRESYLQPQTYWPVDHPQIQELARKLKTPKAIYDFVVQTLDYDYQRIGQAERLGALRALNYPQMSLCLEFTDLFITLCRAAGIPAREINGFAQTENPKLQPLSLKQDILHAWPEYWDEQEQVWRPVDPTWEKTTRGLDFFNKLDLDHFAFVIHGQQSQWPASPGEGPEKNVQVVFAEKAIPGQESLAVSFDFPDQVIAGQAIRGQVVVKNQGNLAFHQLQLTINQQSELIIVLPPFGQQAFPLTLTRTPWWQTRKEKIIVQANDYFFEKEIKIQPFFLILDDFLLKLLTKIKTLF